MATYSVGTTGAKKLTAQLRALSKDIEAAVIDAAVAGGNEIQGEARRLIMKTAKTGEVYKARGIGTWRASAAGEAPANRTGALQSSIDTRRTEDGATVGIHDGTGGKGKNTLEYAWRLEFGFIGADKKGRLYGMAARPFLTPAITSKKELIEKLFQVVINNKIKAANK